MTLRAPRRVLALAAALAVASIVGVSGVDAADHSPSRQPGSTDTIPSVGPAKDLGDVALFDTAGRQIDSGDGATVWQAVLPEGATCPGDSAHDQWRIQGFFVPEDDPEFTQLVYGIAGPRPVNAGRYSLYTLDTASFSNKFLRDNGGPGKPGIISIPPMSFSPIAADKFAGGRYRLGFACTFFGQTAQYWDTIVEMSAAPGGTGAELTWTIPEPASDVAAPSTSDDNTLLIVVVVVAVLGAGLLIRRSTIARSATTNRSAAHRSAAPTSTNHESTKES